MSSPNAGRSVEENMEGGGNDEQEHDPTMEEIDEAPLPSPPSGGRRTTRSARRAAQAAREARPSDSTSESDQRSKKRRLTLSPSIPPAKKARRASDEQPAPGEATISGVAGQPLPSFPQESSESGEKGDGTSGGSVDPRHVTGDNEVQKAEDVEMVESAKDTNEKFASSDAIVSNGTHQAMTSAQESPMEAVLEVVSHTDQPVRAPSVDRLRLPYQHTPGKLPGTDIVHDQEVIPLPQSFGVDQQDSSNLDEPLSNDLGEGQREDAPRASMADVNLEHSGDVIHESHHAASGEPETPQQEVSIQQPLDDDERVENSENVDPTSPVGACFTSVLFWSFVFFFFNFFFLRNFHQHVVGSSKSLASLYHNVFSNHRATSLTPTAIDTIASGGLGSQSEGIKTNSRLDSVNQTLLREKIFLRESNEEIAKRNAQVEQQNKQRIEFNVSRSEKLDSLMLSNERIAKENEEILSDVQSLEAVLLEKEATQTSMAREVEDLSVRLNDLLDEFQRQREQLLELLPTIASKHHQSAQDLASTSTMIHDEKVKMEELSLILAKIVESGMDFDQTDNIDTARKLLGESEDHLLDIDAVDLWKPSTPSLDCRVSPGTRSYRKKKTTGLTEETAAALMKDFEDEVLQEIEGFIQHAEFIDYFNSMVDTVADDFPVESLAAEAPQLSFLPASRPTMDDVRSWVKSRMQQELADRTDRFDFASLHSGAKVLHHLTSPSFAESLPVLNRLGALLSLKSYGYGAEAALTPTWPSNSLGQCWAFERDEANERVGRFADLTVQLAQRILVDSVLIEHPPEEISGQPTSAIKQFQVIGYEDMNASGTPWHLGTFTYDIVDRRKSSLQEFHVPREIDGDAVPQLGTIKLAIDSNWGESISCLYRVRVHGIV